MSPAREIAFRVLQRVSGGGYATDLLRRESGDARDLALAETIVLGCLRYQGQLDHLITFFSGRAQSKLDEEVRIALRMGIFQLRYLDRIPAHAAVTDSVELVKLAHKRSATGFVNAVLRKVNRDPVKWPDQATELSLPRWMWDRWQRQYGADVAAGIARAALEEPEAAINPDTGRQQDPGAQSIVPLLEIEPGMTMLDLCAKLTLPCEQRPLQKHDLYVADEMFLTGTGAEVMPVTKIDGRTVGSGVAGPVTKRLMDAFHKFVREG